jgi:hypothetical protein
MLPLHAGVGMYPCVSSCYVLLVLRLLHRSRCWRVEVVAVLQGVSTARSVSRSSHSRQPGVPSMQMGLHACGSDAHAWHVLSSSAIPVIRFN